MTKMIPLTDGAQRLSMSWDRAWRAMLNGRLEGKKLRGHWFVTVTSVESWAAEREREQPVIGAGTPGGQ